MLKFLDQTSVASAFRDLEPTPKEIRIAVAFWGQGAVHELGLERQCSGARVLCNLQSGACNPAVVRTLIENGAKVQTCDHLHSKVYLTDIAVIVGSSNASANGLAYEKGELNGWHEANVLTDCPEFIAEISEWFERMWVAPGSIEIDPESDMFKDAEAMWSRRRAQLPWPRDPNSLLDACRLNPAKLHNVFFAIYDERLDREAEARRKKIANGSETVNDLPLALRNELWAYQGWDEIPAGAWLIDIYIRNAPKQPVYPGYAKVHDPAITDELQSGSILTYAIRQSRNRKGVTVEQGRKPLTLSDEDKALLSRHIKILFPKAKDETVGGMLVRLPDAVRKIDDAETKRKIADNKRFVCK